ncbi:MAG: hypothetical protein KJO00_10735 [Bacteroidia bacterium]|nr:hypothetical protein [Bacteroidia bacterium]
MRRITAAMIMIKKILLTGVSCFGFLLLLNCEQSRLTASEIVTNACEAHGGLDKWQQLKTLEFNKSTALFFDDGSVESDVNQSQSFTFSSKPNYRIAFKQDTSTISLIYDNGFVHKRVNGFVESDSTQLESAKSSLMAALYVISQPFALLDDAVELTRVDDLEIDGKSLYAVRARYPDDGPDSDKWTYYFDQNDFTLLFNKVELTDHTSWIENLTFDDYTGIKFNAHRTSYRLDEDGNKTYLRAEYYYRNFKATYR